MKCEEESRNMEWSLCALERDKARQALIEKTRVQAQLAVDAAQLIELREHRLSGATQ